MESQKTKTYITQIYISSNCIMKQTFVYTHKNMTMAALKWNSYIIIFTSGLEVSGLSNAADKKNNIWQKKKKKKRLGSSTFGVWTPNMFKLSPSPFNVVQWSRLLIKDCMNHTSTNSLITNYTKLHFYINDRNHFIDPDEPLTSP